MASVRVFGVCKRPQARRPLNLSLRALARLGAGGRMRESAPTLVRVGVLSVVVTGWRAAPG